MKDSLSNQNSYLFNNCWEKVNTNKQLSINIEKTTEFLKLMVQQQSKLNGSNLKNHKIDHLEQKIHNFILKYIQQKQLINFTKHQLTFVKQSSYKLDLKDCIQIWRWLNQDINCFSKQTQINLDESNQFDMGKSSQTNYNKKKVNQNSNKTLFTELSLQQQQQVMKKSLEMVHMYHFQFKIIFNHYCRFTVQNQHKRTTTFDDVSYSLEILTINRFMIFCRDFDVIKILEFKTKTQHNPNMRKKLLLQIFKKVAHLQKYMNFQCFMMSLVNISIKIHQNFDPRSYMHIQLFLNSLKVKYHQQFVKKLQSLSIKYSPSEFYNCYKNILKKSVSKRKANNTNSLFNNKYFNNLEAISAKNNGNPKDQYRVQQKKIHQQQRQSIARTHQNVSPKLLNPVQKRKTSLPLLPKLEQNRFYKPIQHNNHINNFSSYLKQVEQTSSVFKNRIIGYKNVNDLKSKPFHLANNPESISKQTFLEFISDKKQKISSILSSQQPQIDKNNHDQLQQSIIYQKQKIQPNLNSIKANLKLRQIEIQPKLIQKVSQNQEIKEKSTKNIIYEQSPAQKQKILLPLLIKQIIDKKQHDKIIQNLKKQLDIQDEDELLNKHLKMESNKQDQINSKLIETGNQS